MNNEKMNEIFFIVAILLCPILYIFVYYHRIIPIDLISGIFSSISILIAAGSYMAAKYALHATEDALKISDKTLSFTVNDQKRRDIENSLHYFYYPLQSFLNYHILKYKYKGSHHRYYYTFASYCYANSHDLYHGLENISFYKYLSDEIVRTDFEKIQQFQKLQLTIFDFETLLFLVEYEIRKNEKNLKT